MTEQKSPVKFFNKCGIAQKLASIASLQARSVPVYFAGSPCLAATFYRHCVRQNIMKNWERWIS